MDDELNRLKKAMDQTVLKEGTFTHREKQNVLSRVQHKTIRPQKVLKALFSGAVCLGLLVVLSFYFMSDQQEHPSASSESKSKTAVSTKASQKTEKHQEAAGDASTEQVENVTAYDYASNAQSTDIPGHFTFNQGNYVKSNATVRGSQINKKLNTLGKATIYSIVGQEVASAIAVRYDDDEGQPMYWLYHRNTNELLTLSSKEMALYLFKNKAIQLKQVDLKTDWGPGLMLTYSEVKEPEQTIIVKEYEKKKAPVASTSFNQDALNKGNVKSSYAPHPKATFVANGIRWTEYIGSRTPILLRGEKENYYYEVTANDEKSLPQLKTFVKQFVPYKQ
ncbi:hypothetical protein GCM10011391_15880 [Pullulanibacillus camelliae]|uniref:Uncharacterized protein n=1 Tax=Pullulanibacillus camelliae TaxID=1707096 RepID=A0A8J2VSZ3_9BACL|nr:hypothetical protein [Pullulanibacillus camelliae]GGE37909.1 hypothetical protein GCM10011391_15880 [Pullulanibacillus camelliae]